MSSLGGKEESLGDKTGCKKPIIKALISNVITIYLSNAEKMGVYDITVSGLYSCVDNFIIH